MRTSIVMLAVLPVLVLGLLAQGTPAAPPATYMSSADIAAGLASVKAADAAAGAAVTVAPGISVRRRSTGQPQYAIVHPFSMEIYYIVEGTASLVTGGVLDPPPATPDNPDVIRSEAIVRGETRRVSKGDVVVMPPGTPHWFDAIDGDVVYLESRVRVK